MREKISQVRLIPGERFEDENQWTSPTVIIDYRYIYYLSSSDSYIDCGTPNKHFPSIIQEVFPRCD